MTDARFLFVVSEGPEATVIDSQVVDPIVAVRREGIPFDLLFLADARAFLKRRRFYARRCEEIAERTGGRVRVVAAPGKTRSAFAAAALLLAEAAPVRARRTVVHARTDWSAYFASRARRLDPRIRYVYDARGDSEAEFLVSARTRGLDPAATERHAARIRHVRRVAIARAEHVLCVSRVLRDRLVAKDGLDPERATVVPCVADAQKFHPDDAERSAARRELGVDDRFVVVYPGRFGRWHLGETTSRVVRGLMDADPDVFFLVLTPDVDEAAQVLRRTLPVDRFEIRAARHAEVPRYLRAADAGILLRAPDPLNEVACPTKFAEYVLSGLPVLISAGIGDCSGFVEKHAAGAVLPEPDPACAVEALRRIRREDGARRRARIAAAGATLSRQRFAETLAALYRRVAQAP